MTTPTSQQVLATPMAPNDAGAVIIRDYLKALLTSLWSEGEDFSTKRPFGNSGWQRDVYRALVAANLVPGSFDEYGCLEQFSYENRVAADRLIQQAIEALQ